jgi:hypothetical protein
LISNAVNKIIYDLFNLSSCHPINLFLIGCKGRETGAEWQKKGKLIEKFIELP